MIIFDNVSKVYPNGVVGLKDIDLTIEDGEFVSIIGLSGAGKSTLLRSINRLAETTKGDIRSQSFNLVKRSTVQKNVLSGRLGYYSTWKSILGLFTKEDYQQTKEALEKVGLSDKLQTRSDELSGGQQQRVSIARALVQQAPIILADEPVASLDPITTQKVMMDLKNINQTMDKTVIVNLHSVPLAREFSTRVLALKAAQVVFDGRPDDLTDERLEQIYGNAIFEEKAGEIDELERNRSL